MVTISTDLQGLEKLTDDGWKPANLSHLEYVAIRLLSVNRDERWINFEVIQDDCGDRGEYRCISFDRVRNNCPTTTDA